MNKKLFFSLWILSLSACQSAPSAVVVNLNKPVPALLTSNNGEACYQQLSLRLGEAINHPVHVSLDVFSTTSTMFLEPVVKHNVDGTRKDGMIVDKPNQFKLELVRQQCLLTQVNKQWQSSLPLCLCQSSN
jgi:starvation-inducible outer membrane lipoprotein